MSRCYGGKVCGSRTCKRKISTGYWNTMWLTSAKKIVSEQFSCRSRGFCGASSTHAIGIVVPLYILPKSSEKNLANAGPLRFIVNTRLAWPYPVGLPAAIRLFGSFWRSQYGNHRARFSDKAPQAIFTSDDATVASGLCINEQHVTLRRGSVANFQSLENRPKRRLVLFHERLSVRTKEIQGIRFWEILIRADFWR